ncbi:pentatricopeptide repeat-containing protein [Gossypium australe]|uniref:Pentatricopeptide repeat-containing protein n=1 Tax=Gossypium australe TaxID=47621 RepID=A0A5B6X6N7_9ROSI|nr:pentatricopeptide repeat-containing protein [Gossypium australe]
MPHLHAIFPLPSNSKPFQNSNIFSSSSSSFSSSAPIRRRLPRTFSPSKHPNLKRLTSRIVQLTRRRQLHQILEEIENAKREYGKLNTIVMNAVMEACVHCGDVDLALNIFHQMTQPHSCGVDTVTYATLLKGLGRARRIDDAFQLLESVEKGTAAGKPKLSTQLIYGLLDALIEAGQCYKSTEAFSHSGGLIDVCHPFLSSKLSQGYINTGCPQAAINLHEEIQLLGLEPDRLTYNTLIFACVKAENLEAAMRFFKEMKDKAQQLCCSDLYPDVITYTTLLKGFGHAKDLHSVQKIVLEMKSCNDLFIDRTAFTAMVDAMLNCGSIKGALCIFGEILKQAGANADLRPKPHLYLSMMRVFADRGDYNMVKNLHERLWPDSAGTISLAAQQEADHLLMESALNNGQIDAAVENLTKIINRWKSISWTSRGGMVALRIEVVLGFNKSMLSPYLLPQVLPGNPIERIMLPLETVRPLPGSLELKKVVMRLYREPVVPIIDDWGSCIGLLHREDCCEMNAPLSAMMRSPPPCVTTTTSIGHVVDLVLKKKYKMVIVVKHSNLNGTTHGSRAVGVFTAEQLHNLVAAVPEGLKQKHTVRRSLTMF